MHDREIPIWFFIGILIVGAGVWEIFHPPANPVVLFHLHANVWWGAVLLLLGIVYCVRFAPARQS